MLLRPQQITGTTDLQITHRDLKPGAQLCKITNRLQTFFCDLAQSTITFIDEIGISQTRGAPYPAAHLIQLRQAKIFGSVDNNSIGQGHIQTIFDDRSRQQHITAAFIKSNHCIFQHIL